VGKMPLQRSLAVSLFLVAANAPRAHAQQPFFTDNADVAERHRWHLESNNEYDVLPASSFPNLRQDTHTVKFSFGAFENCEVGMDFPVITIFNSTGSGLGTPIGFGDADFSIKYNFRKERDGSRWPAFTASLNIEPPTGDSKKQLGSGLTDYYLNGIVQKTLSPKNILHINGGATFAGNTLTGAIGIKARGTILTGGVSFLRQLTKRLGLGAEVYGGREVNSNLGRGELQEQIGGNYMIGRSLSIDFGVVAGQAVGSPHYGVQLGFSKDF
jgi:hypothetical protein